MNSSIYTLIVIIFLVIIMFWRERKNIIAKKTIKKRKMEGNIEMIELAKRFIGKECLIYAFDSSHQYEGVIKEVSDGAILIENNGTIEVINLDFVIRIREYPKNKKGNKKSFVLD